MNGLVRGVRYSGRQNWHPTFDALDVEIYPAVNNGVYRTGFATSQTAYEEAVSEKTQRLPALRRYLPLQARRG